LEGFRLENVDICILLPFGIFCGDLGYFLTIWYILFPFGTFLPAWVSCTNKNLATLSHSETKEKNLEEKNFGAKKWFPKNLLSHHSFHRAPTYANEGLARKHGARPLCM
jgi:hypothetical protein